MPAFNLHDMAPGLFAPRHTSPVCPIKSLHCPEAKLTGRCLTNSFILAIRYMLRMPNAMNVSAAWPLGNDVLPSMIRAGSPEA